MKRDVRQRPLAGFASLERCHGEMDTTFRHTNTCAHLQWKKKKMRERETGVVTDESILQKKQKNNNIRGCRGDSY